VKRQLAIGGIDAPQDFIGSALSAGLFYASSIAKSSAEQTEDAHPTGAPNRCPSSPMTLGLLIKPFRRPEETIARVNSWAIDLFYR